MTRFGARVSHHDGQINLQTTRSGELVFAADLYFQDQADLVALWMVDDIKVRCLEIHDLIVNKLAAGRLKDYEFIVAVFTNKLARPDEVVRRVQTFSDPHQQAVLLARLRIATEATDVRL